MAKDVEKFKELYIKTLNQSRRFAIFGINDEDYEKYDKDKQELLKMYEELEEKPIIKCNYELSYGPGYGRVKWTGKTGVHHDIYSEAYEEKDNMLITDDFIFIKEEN